jgi:hypothetical protein
LDAACPQLEQSLDDLGLDKVLYDGWRERLDAHGVRDLAALAQHYAEPESRPLISEALLPGILQSLKHPEVSGPKSWWDTFREWLLEWFQHSDSALARWLRELLQHVEVSPTVLLAISVGLLALLVIGGIMVVAHQIMLWSASRKRSLDSNDSGITPGAPVPGPAAGSAAAVDPVSALFRSLVDLLRRTGRLKVDRSLTHRELVARSCFDDELQRSAFAGVAGAAETILYGPRPCGPQESDQALQQGEMLLAQLSRGKPI